MNLAKTLYAQCQDLLVLSWECPDPQAAAEIRSIADRLLDAAIRHDQGNEGRSLRACA